VQRPIPWGGAHALCMATIGRELEFDGDEDKRALRLRVPEHDDDET
jgi:hypothetical protein